MSLIWRKIWVASTGLFLCIFLMVHLSVNSLLLLPEPTSIQLYNEASTFLRENLLLKVVAYLLYASILTHVLYGVLISIKNKKAKGIRTKEVSYTSSFASRSMLAMGMLILVFIVIHLFNFWWRIKLGFGAPLTTDSSGLVDVYQVTHSLFQQPVYVAFYSLLCVPLGIHLYHGVYSGVRSIGVYSTKLLQMIKVVSLIYAVIVSAGFAVIPIVLYLR